MKELTSKKTGKVQFVSDDVYNELVRNGRHKKYNVREVKPIIAKAPKILEPEKKVIKPNKK
jgi:CRISPR/Cas system CSM-associated protein Csm4 (group 5 of RAMP superfamily)